MLLLGALLRRGLLGGRPAWGPVRLDRVAYSTRLRTSSRPASWQRASWRRVFAWRRPWLMCLRYLARGRERWRSIRGSRRLRTTRRPGARARANARGTVPRASLPPHRARHDSLGAQTQRNSNWPDAPAARCGSTRQDKATPCAPHRGISVGVQAHVIAAIAPRSDGLSRATHVQIASWVTALRWLCVMVFWRVSWRCPVAATALRLSEQVQGILDAVRAVYGGTGNARLCLPGFLRYFFIAAIPRRPATSDAIHYATSRAHPPRNYPKTTGPRRHDAANDARARSETTATTPLRPGLPPLGTGYKTHKTTLEHRRHVLERIDRPRSAAPHHSRKLLIIDVAVPLQIPVLHERLHELVGGPRP